MIIFNPDKSKCMSVGKSIFENEPKWYMNDLEICNVDKLEILGNVDWDWDWPYQRITKCRKYFYSLSPVGILYPGASPGVQSYLFKRICQPTITYGADCMNITDKDMGRLDSVQGQLLKQSLGLSKRSHNSELLHALNIPRITDIVDRNVCSLFNRICNVNSPSRNICMFYLSQYVLYGKLTQGTLLHRVVRSSQSPLDLAFSSTVNLRNNDTLHDGHIDSIKMLLYHENFMKPYSDEHLLVHLLTTPML